MIHVSEWYVFSKEGSSLRQRALYSDACNRLQQTATDCNRLQQKEGSSLHQRALYSDEKEPYTSSNDQATSLCPISLSAYLSIHASIYLCVSVSMRVCEYLCIHASMHLCVYPCIYLSIYLYIHIYYLVDTLTSCRAASAIMQ